MVLANIVPFSMPLLNKYACVECDAICTKVTKYPLPLIYDETLWDAIPLILKSFSPPINESLSVWAKGCNVLDISPPVDSRSFPNSLLSKVRAPYVKAAIITAPNLCFAKNPNTLCFARNVFILLAFLATIAFDDLTSVDNDLPAVLAAAAAAAPFATLL